MTDPTIHQALAAVMTDVRAVGKDGRNTSQNYNFRGIDGVLNAVGPALRTHRVVILPQLLSLTSEQVPTKNGGMSREVTVLVRYEFAGPAGDTLGVTVPGEAQDWGDKGVSKAMSVALRTALIQTLALPTDDVDPDAQSYERAPSAPRKRASRRAVQPPVRDLGVHTVDGDPIGDMIPAASAKQSLATTLAGDLTAAAEVWGERGSDPISPADLAVLLDQAEARMAAPFDGGES